MPQDDASHSVHGKVVVGGDLSGQVGVGSHITQQQLQGAPASITAEDRAALEDALAELRGLVGDQTDDSVRAAAEERVDELSQTLLDDATPDLGTLEYVRGWLLRHVRPAGEAVNRLLLSPLVGKLVGAGGDALVAEFQRRFGV